MSEFENAVEQPAFEQVENTEVKNEEVVENVENSVSEENATSISQSGSTGKFKDTQSLLNAYNNLQAEFTRKCQKLSELENSVSVDAVEKSSNVDDYINNNPQLVKEILEHYLTDIKNHTAPATISNNVGSGIPLTPPPTPQTLEEAREVVKNIFK